MHGGLFFGQQLEDCPALNFLQQGKGRVLLALSPLEIYNIKAE